MSTQKQVFPSTTCTQKSSYKAGHKLKYFVSQMVPGHNLKHYLVTNCAVVAKWSEPQIVPSQDYLVAQGKKTLIARFMRPTWDPPGADRTQVCPLSAPWILLSGEWSLATHQQLIWMINAIYHALILISWRFYTMNPDENLQIAFDV